MRKSLVRELFLKCICVQSILRVWTTETGKYRNNYNRQTEEL